MWRECESNLSAAKSCIWRIRVNIHDIACPLTLPYNILVPKSPHTRTHTSKCVPVASQSVGGTDGELCWNRASLQRQMKERNSSSRWPRRCALVRKCMSYCWYCKRERLDYTLNRRLLRLFIHHHHHHHYYHKFNKITDKPLLSTDNEIMHVSVLMKRIRIQHSSEKSFCLRGQKDDENVDNYGNGCDFSFGLQRQRATKLSTVSAGVFLAVR